MFVVSVDTEQCNGCGQCADSCPGQILSVVDAKMQVTDDSAECLGCQSCVIVCESHAISIEEF
jgi:NAD-dependent dihydropyrimidine dehydrogenase PreA subunit